jgi:hypothetical protein
MYSSFNEPPICVGPCLPSYWQRMLHKRLFCTELPRPVAGQGVARMGEFIAQTRFLAIGSHLYAAGICSANAGDIRDDVNVGTVAGKGRGGLGQTTGQKR